MATKKKADVLQTLPPITAGALATATLMYPVDLVRALRMSSAAEKNVGIGTLLSNFKKVHGYKGFVTQGVVPEMMRATYMRVLKFFLFPITHRALFDKNPSAGTTATKAIAAGLASIPEGFTIAPLEVAKIGLQLDKEKRFNNSTTAVMRHVVKTRGWTGLFMGYTGVQYRQTSWTAVYFATLSDFENLTKKVIPNEYKEAQQLTSGFLAGMLGAAFNTPGDVIRSALKKKLLADPNPVMQRFSIGLCVDGVKTFFTLGNEIMQVGGIRALYAGFAVKSVHLGGSGALLAMFIPFFKRIMGVDQE